MVKNLPNAFRDPEKEHGGPSNLPAFRDPEKEHHWHRSHEFNSVTGMQATAFYIRVCLKSRIPQQFP